ncbi:MAG: hypothetical protein GX596_01530 [Propionibacterium sp.]|nr:hypothetical protein [Propionibacterium sp.]
MLLQRFSVRGGAEITLGSLWIVASALSAVAGLISPLALLFDAVGFLAVILITRRRWPGLAVTCAALVVSVVVIEPGQYGFLWVQALIGVVSLLRERRVWQAALQTAFALPTIMAVGLRAGDDLVPIAVSVVIVGALAWGVGWGFHRDGQLAAARERGRFHREQLRIAGDLHDFVARDLTLISMRAEAAIAKGGATVDELRDIAGHSRAANQFLRETAAALDGSHPPALQPLVSVTSALEIGGRDLEVQERALHVDGAPPTAGDIVDAVAGRLLLEALHNAVKHGTGKVDVRFRDERSHFAVEIANITRRTPPTRGTSFGTRAMVHRATVFGGELTSRQEGDVWLCSFTLPKA